MGTDEQIAKLPKWAQLELNRLRRDLVLAESKLDQIENATGPLRHTDGKRVVGIPERNTIEADIDGRIIEIEMREGVLRISAKSGSLRIRPDFANVVHVWAEGRR